MGCAEDYHVLYEYNALKKIVLFIMTLIHAGIDVFTWRYLEQFAHAVLKPVSFHKQQMPQWVLMDSLNMPANSGDRRPDPFGCWSWFVDLCHAQVAFYVRQLREMRGMTQFCLAACFSCPNSFQYLQEREGKKHSCKLYTEGHYLLTVHYTP